MKVLSLFDGISCGRVALKRAGIKVEKYFASEIDKYAIEVSKKNHKDIVQLGDVTKVTKESLGCKIDLLIGGSPCQGFSFAGKQLNFNDPRSKLFFEFVRLLKELKPKYFLLENVPMKKEFETVISEHLGVEPVLIDSSLVSAQRRKRLYWTNIPIKSLPRDRGVMLKDIILENSKQSKKCSYDLEKYKIPIGRTLTILKKEESRRKIIGYVGGSKASQSNTVYQIHGKSVTISANGGGMGAKTGLYLFGVITPDRLKKRQNGQRFNDGEKFYTLTAQDRHGGLVDGYIRKLTPIECERLQTLPDGYTEGVSDSQRYKMLGNGWTVDVISHIFKGLKK